MLVLLIKGLSAFYIWAGPVGAWALPAALLLIAALILNWGIRNEKKTLH